MIKTGPDALKEMRDKRDWKPSRPGGRPRRKLVWGALAVASLLIAAYLAGLIGGRAPEAPKESVVDGPPPVVSASGPVVPARRARLSFTVSGRVKTVAVQAGDQVKQGQILAQLEPSTVQSGASPDGGFGTPGGSDLYLVAPFDATVGLVSVNEWETITPGSTVMTLGDLSSMRVEIEDLSETDVGRLQVGQTAQISFEAFPGRRVAGRVARISPMNNSKGGGVNYDIVVEFVGADLPPFRWGMTAHVDIEVGSGR